MNTLDLCFMSLLAIGTIAFDSIKTPFASVEQIIGGSLNYIAWSASHICKDIQLSAVVGDDYPQEEIDMLKQKGVDFENVEQILGEKTFFWSGEYHMNFNDRDTLQTDLNVLKKYNPVLNNKARKAEYVMLGNLTPSVQLNVLSQLENPKVVALDTMNYWIENKDYRKDLDAVIEKIDLLIINDEEARMLGNHHSIVKSAKYIMAYYDVPFVVVKRGEHGALLFHRDKVFFAPALPLEEVFDPTGAGDSFAGGLMGYLSTSKEFTFENLKRAVIHGSMMASFCVEKFGPTRLKELDFALVENRLQDFVDLVQVDIILR